MSSRDKHAVVLLPKGWTDFSFVELKHPRTEKGQLFAFNGDKSQLCEVVCVNDPHSAWFIGNSIESDGRMQMLTPMDPLLLAIPYLRKSERPVPLDDLIEDQDFSHINDLVPLLTRDKMNKIATSKGSEDLNVWVWNEEKCLEYLVSKVDKLKEHIKEKGMTTLDNTSSTNYISAKRKDETEEEEDCKRFAWEFLSDFLQDDISAKLGKAIKLKENAVLKPQQPAKKAKLDNASQGPKDDFYDKNGSSNNAKSQESQNAKQKALAKSAKGTKNIASFFARK